MTTAEPPRREEDPIRRAAREAQEIKVREVGANKLAALVLGNHLLMQDAVGSMFMYNGRHWEPITDESLLSLIFSYENESTTTATRRNEALNYIKAATHYRELQWGRVGDWEIATESGVADVATGAVRAHRADDYLESVIPWPWQPDARCVLWRKFLGESFGDDLDKWDALQEFFGYVALPHAKLKRALLLYGPSDTGKSVVLHVLRCMVGAEHTASLGVQHMDDPRRLFALVGKRLNIISEISTDAMVADGGFKALVSTEESVLVDPKFKNAFSYRPTCKHAIATNTLPFVSDRTAATFNRLLLIPFSNTVAASDQDPELFDKLAAEMPGILQWAAAGARRLADRKGRWTEVAAGAEVMAEFKTDSNPVLGFVAERMVPDPDDATPLAAIVRSFNAWFGGRSHDARWIGKRLRAAGYTIGPARSNGVVAKCLIGFRLSGNDVSEPPAASEAWTTGDTP
ncbi:MAG: phage/plasmid primase, P4 family [Alphaproteobacteria bacterium]